MGGFIFNIANVLLIAGIDMVGLAVAFPLSIGIALVEGTALSYLLHPQGSAILLGAGVFDGAGSHYLRGPGIRCAGPGWRGHIHAAEPSCA